MGQSNFRRSTKNPSPACTIAAILWDRPLADPLEHELSALVPCAGLGRSMRPWSASIPKELLPIGRTTALDYTLTELHYAGFRRAIITYSPAKELVPRWVDDARSDRTCHWSSMNVILHRQETASGSGAAITQCMQEMGIFDLLVAYPDQLRIDPRRADLRALCNKDLERSCVEIHRVTSVNERYFSPTGEILEYTKTDGSLVCLRELRTEGKNATFEALPTMKVFGRMRLQRDFLAMFNDIVKTTPAESAIEDINVLSHLARQKEGLLGFVGMPDLVNIGSWQGYWTFAPQISASSIRAS